MWLLLLLLFLSTTDLNGKMFINVCCVSCLLAGCRCLASILLLLCVVAWLVGWLVGSRHCENSSDIFYCYYSGSFKWILIFLSFHFTLDLGLAWLVLPSRTSPLPHTTPPHHHILCCNYALT